MKLKSLLILPLCLASMQAATVADLTFTLINGNTEYSVSDCLTSASGSLEIPSTNNGLPVTSIRGQAFSNCSGLTSITIPDSVTSIEYFAFYNCSGLTSISIPDSVNSIGNNAFKSCSSLAIITIGNSVTSIGEGAFWNCTNLTSLSLPDSLISIGKVAFYGTGLSFQEDTNSIKYLISASGNTAYLIDGSSSTGSVVLPNTLYGASVAIIRDGAFNHSGLTSITIGDGVTSLGIDAFQYCSNLHSVIFEGDAPTFGTNAFGENNSEVFRVYYDSSKSGWSGTAAGKPTVTTNILTLTLNNAGTEYSVTNCIDTASGSLDITSIFYGLPVTSIGSSAFNNCTNLISIIIPDSVNSIGDSAFYNCINLIGVTFEGDAPTFGTDVFFSSDSVTVYYDSSNSGWSSTVAGKPAVDTYSPMTFTLNSDSSGYIVSDCIDNAYGSLDIPTIHNGLPVTSIGLQAFRNCSGLTSVTIPDSVTSIGNGAFRNCSGLTSLTIPDSVTSIGQYTFANCSGLTSLTIPDSVTSIGQYTFANCAGLTSFTIPDSVTSIGDSAFYNCINLSSIIIPDSVTTIEQYAFFRCEALSITLNNSSLNLNSAGSDLYNRVTNITIPEGTTEIANYAFYGCSNVTSITIPDSVTSIGLQAFSNCSSLSSITIPDGVTSIGNSTFANCNALSSITIPDSVTSIGDSAFASCTSLSSITIPDSVNSIIYSAFNNCTSLNSISFSNPLLEAAEAERDARLTMDEVRDARIGSTMIEVSEGKADITMTLEETSDLSNWSGGATSNKTIQVDAPSGTRFYRFKMTE